MESSTTIRKMMAGNNIVVPTYQRAYSWETPREQSNRKTHTDVFLTDLDDYQKSDTHSPYYFGHFLFEEKGESSFHVIDGQQRLTTIVIFVCALFLTIKSRRNLSDYENECFEDMVRRGTANYRFSTVGYDDQLFKDYVINQVKKDTNGLETQSAKRIVQAFDFFNKHLINKDESYLTKTLEIIEKSTCTTYPVKNESEAIQMFIFQNNRGKKPSDMEVIKAQFMYNIHLYGGSEKESLIEEVKNRFEKIYKTIASIDYKIDEDDVLVYTLRVYFDTLSKSGAQEIINEQLSYKDKILFIKNFSHALCVSFENLDIFFRAGKNSYFIHSLISLGGIATALPFVIKAYSFGLNENEIETLCSSLESLILRQRIIGSRADITTRINDVFMKFTLLSSSIQPIVDTVNKMKTTTEWWWAYWNNEELERALQNGLDHSVAKFLLWKYENSLRGISERGYGFYRFDEIKFPELEHIAPTKEPKEKPHGYDIYDEEFIGKYLNCLGNYLLTSKPHNASLQNDPFQLKLKRYTELKQQFEVQELGKNGIWNRAIIQNRKEKIVNFVMGIC